MSPTLNRVRKGPISDERGFWHAAAQSWLYSFERSQEPWRRAMKRSNGRLIRSMLKIKSIRGIHNKTVGMRNTQW